MVAVARHEEGLMTSRASTGAPAGTPRERPQLLDIKTLPGRLALSPVEAAEALGVGITFFQEHIQPDLPIVRIGRRRLVPVAALVAWLEANAVAVEETAMPAKLPANPHPRSPRAPRRSR